jgi:hypothetical protein
VACLFGQLGQHELLGEHFHGQDVDKECATAESLHGQEAQDGLGGQDGRRQYDNVGMSLTEVVYVSVEGGPHSLSQATVVPPRCS